MRRDFEGSVAIVTGSTQGLGAAVARQFAERGGAGVVITGRDEARGLAVAADLEGLGCRSVFVGADLADRSAPARIIEAADATFGHVDVLVNSAAATDRDTIWETSHEHFDRMVAVNTRAPWFLMQGTVELMVRERVEGTIVNVLSISSHAGQPLSLIHI